MAIQLFKLRNVPDDEAEEVRALLADNQIEITETRAGFLGLGTAAIWVLNPDDKLRAQALLAEYQQNRAESARAAYEKARIEGTTPTVLDLIRSKPGQLTAYLLALVVILYLMLAPFFNFAAY